MKKTLLLLAELNLKELKILKNPEDSPTLQAFLTQLNEDYNEYVHDPNFDPIKQAENLLRVTRALAIEDTPGINKKSKDKIDIIYDLYEGMGHHAYRLMEMYQCIDTVNHEQQELIKMKTIKTIVEKYSSHLGQKLENEGINVTDESQNSNNCLNSKSKSSYQEHLFQRYEAISDLEKHFKGKSTLDENDKSIIESALKKCIKNKPDWSERPFLQKLCDVISFGVTALFRALLSKEQALKDELIEVISVSKPGGPA